MKNLKNAFLLKQLYYLKALGYQYTSIVPYKEDESRLNLPYSLELLKKQARECHLCTLSKTRERVVFSQGNEDATIMFIGDNPSSSDESSGSIFTGRSGEMLTKMIENVLQIKREDVYLANILKCHTPEGQEISPKHAYTCQLYLFKEIELVQPRVIVTLGENAYYYLTGDDTPLHTLKGVIQTKEHYKIIPTYHPNYLLRNPSKKKEVLKDLQTLKNLL